MTYGHLWLLLAPFGLVIGVSLLLLGLRAHLADRRRRDSRRG